MIFPSPHKNPRNNFGIFSVGAVTEEVLHSRYLAHVKRESRSYVNQVLKEEKEIDQEEEDGDNVRLVEQELEESSIQEKQQWTEEMREQLWAEKIHVEEKLRCIQDEHFYELLQVLLSDENDCSVIKQPASVFDN